MTLTIDTAAIAHRIRRWLFKLFRTPQTRGRCADCGKALTFDECTYYGTTCERCEGIAFQAQQAAEPPVCADTGAPKWPGNCWNVRCQLGKTCCRAHGVLGDAK